MPKLVVILFFASSLFGSIGLVAQEDEPQNIVTYFTLEQGLHERSIVNILQDSIGLLWIVTTSGISQYDGYSFTKLEDLSEHFMLNDNAIEQAILFQNQNILNFYIYNDHFFDQVSLDDYSVTQVLYSDISSKGQINARSSNDDGTIVFSFVVEDSLHFFNWDGKRAYALMALKMDKIYDEYVYQFTYSHEEQFLICTPENVLHVSTDGNIINSFPFDKYKSIDPDGNRILKSNLFKKDRLNRTWISFENMGGVLSRQKNGNYFSESKILGDSFFVENFWEDDQGNLLFSFNAGTKNRVVQLSLIDSNNTIHDFSHVIDVYPTITGIYASDFFDYLILGSHLGFAKVNNKVNTISTYLYEDTKNGKWGASIFGITAGDLGEVFICREIQNWYKYNTQSGELEIKYLTNKLNGEREYLEYGRNIIYDDEILWGSSYVTSKTGQLLKIDKNTFEYESFPYKWPIQYMMKDSRGEVWVLGGFRSGVGMLSKFDTENEVFVEYQNQDESNPLVDKHCRYILEGADGHFYIGTSHGIVIINLEKRTSKLINHFYSGIAKDVICMYEDRVNDEFWVGTLGYGLFRFDSKFEKFTRFTQKNGLANDNVVGIVKDDFENLWFSTSNGISLYRQNPEHFITISEQEGLTYNEFNNYSFLKNDQGELMFGGINGLNVFHPQDIISNLKLPKIFLTNIEYADPKGNGNIISINYSQLSSVKKVVLPYSGRYFRCSFSLTDFNSPDHSSFFYKLDGSSEDWHDLGKQNTIILPSLGQGNYNLAIKGRNYKGMDSSNTISLDILVKAPFYFQLWFIILSLLGVAVFVSLYYYNKIDKLKKLETLRLKISSDLHDDVGGILAALAIRSEVISNNTTDTHRDEFKKVSELSRKALSQMRDIVWTVDSRKNKFSDLRAKIEEYAGELLAENGINYTFELDPELKNLKLDENMKSQILMICKEALTNILKHSGANNVSIIMSKIEGNVTFVVQDDGRSKKVISKAGTGIQNMKMRAEKINAKFDFDSGNGTKITITL